MGNELVIGYSPSDFAKLRESLSFWKNRLQELEKFQIETIPTVLVMYNSSLGIPVLTRISSKISPALPAKGRPYLTSSLPGASPIITTLESVLPSAYTKERPQDPISAHNF